MFEHDALTAITALDFKIAYYDEYRSGLARMKAKLALQSKLNDDIEARLNAVEELDKEFDELFEKSERVHDRLRNFSPDTHFIEMSHNRSLLRSLMRKMNQKTAAMKSLLNEVAELRRERSSIFPEGLTGEMVKFRSRLGEKYPSMN